MSQTQIKDIAEILAFYPGHIVLIEETEDNLARKLFGSDCTEINLPTPDKAQQQLAWLRALEAIGQTGDLKVLVKAFVNNYSMGIGEIFRAVNQAKSQQIKRGQASEPLKSHHLLEEIRKAFDHNLDALADVVVSTTTLDDIVLSSELNVEVEEILQYARHANTVLVDWGFEQRSPYGNALSALFTGPPGTGKTYLAGAIANALGKVLYRVDLSRVIDKYIGETEKNLGKIFDEAGRAQAVLLFDEADSLFAKRTEVKSSNDRYANLEVNFLLQRLESYRGVSILTTNLDKGIDDAFKRRLRFLIHFKMPDAPERARLWKHLMPPRAPRADEIDWMLLGNQFEMTGGYIRNAILRASIQAASKSEPIHMGHLLMAGIEEMRSTGALIKINYEMSDWLNAYGINSGYEQNNDPYYR